MSVPKLSLDIMSIIAGGGHVATANAIKEEIHRRGYPWEVTITYLEPLIEKVDIVKKVLGYNINDLYNAMLKSGHTWLQTVFIQHYWRYGMLALRKTGAKVAADYFAERKADMVLSVVPLYQWALSRGLELAGSKAPLVACLTDLDENHRGYWFEDRSPITFICPTAHAYEQAETYAIPPEYRVRSSGLVVHPRFYDPMDTDCATARRNLGLAPDVPTALVFFGGQGSKQMVSIAEHLEDCTAELQAIYICGHNQEVFDQISALPQGKKRYLVGYTDQIPQLMRISDFIIGKTGAGVFAEAVVSRLPLVVVKNFNTMPQERAVAKYIQDEKIGLVLKSFSKLPEVLPSLLADDALAECRRRLDQINNRGVFECTDTLLAVAQKMEAERSS